ncbi:1,6-anhydro-N-acetylmuramyl-L-alanine amidase AmpD [Aliikangiella maris]|uniref:1,6-anhydro-N-acetylmuramyl-L-alanine amidase AmpD n=2 Tax=Aliikangiella maris TaxID=3162458 RepID=A0ABV2BTX9_9GAMM
MIKHGWLELATKIPSPHFNERPDPDDISLLVIHNISLPPEQFGNDFVEDFFCGKLNCSLDPYFESIRDLRVSSHLFIKRCGALIQFVAFDKRAWHAGVSEYNGHENCNDFSIGIELEGTDHLAYTSAQYTTLQLVTQQLIAEYPQLTPQRIVGHCDIAPGRKTDPGISFDWHYYLDGIES